MNVIAATEYLARSTTFTSVGLVGYIIIGGLAAWRAGPPARSSRAADSAS